MIAHMVSDVPQEKGLEPGDAALQRPWRKAVQLSSVLATANDFLADRGVERVPWLAIVLGTGIVVWFVLGQPWQWVATIAFALFCVASARYYWRERQGREYLSVAITGLGIALALGVALIWVRSELVGATPLSRPAVVTIDGRVLAREDQPALDRTRLTLAYRDAGSGAPRKVRVNVPTSAMLDDIEDGARISLRARLIPPSPPLLPGSYNFARTAWFNGLAATGSLIGEIELVEKPPPSRWDIGRIQRALSQHVRHQVDGSPGAIAATFASGDRSAIGASDENAMRDAGLTHLLSISGLHVSAVMAATYLLLIRLLALWPWLALRVRLPLVATCIAAGAGVGYTLLTGAQVPTVRSCAAALLVLGAMALGREPLSLRIVAVAAVCVMLLWPETVVGPSFQMSFAAVVAIVALHRSAPVQRFMAPREEGVIRRSGRRITMLLITGLVIEIALMPIVLLHFHRAGIYGAIANVFAIPLVTFISMPMIALALLFDIFGLGAPFWWLAGHSLDLLLAIAHFTAEQPGAVRLMPQMGAITFTLFVAGGLWLALWQGRVRLYGLVPVAAGTIALLATPTPDLLITADGRQVGIVGEGDRLLLLRDSKSAFLRDNLLEMAGTEGEPLPLDRWPGARCSREFCTVTLRRGERDWHLLLARGRTLVAERALAAACARSDIVIADRWLPRSCGPQWIKADRRLLSRTGGLTINLETGTVTTVAQSQGAHGWWPQRSR
ncbi:ComEC family competence protein [Altererythrobacter sp. FM1]|uniref:ComEC/Rec2 family competence protein n=1 Tax=Tsuneonella flava TaxID=2055955 RepID=UPI000C7FA725|nr:ComEC/Rec2 family competence protein [Tsuneonella flava]ROT95258.1 ComEC family competence protein [Altererythrobacter sp. FM1]